MHTCHLCCEICGVTVHGENVACGRCVCLQGLNFRSRDSLSALDPSDPGPTYIRKFRILPFFSAPAEFVFLFSKFLLRYRQLELLARVILDNLLRKGETKFGQIQVWPSLVTKFGQTKFGQDQVWPDQVRPRPSLARPSAGQSI